MGIRIREYQATDLEQMMLIWNEVIEDGIAFPQLDRLDYNKAERFFAEQDFSAVAEDTDSGDIIGLYILHPNNVGRCSHIGNTGYAVNSKYRGHGIGTELVRHSIRQASECGFRLIQFNAVVKSNLPAVKIYESLGFQRLGIIPNGFLMKNDAYEDIILYYLSLVE